MPVRPAFLPCLPCSQDFDYQPWHQISAAAKDFVGRLLEKDPDRRMRVAEALTHPWLTDKAADVPLSAGGQRQAADACAWQAGSRQGAVGAHLAAR